MSQNPHLWLPCLPSLHGASSTSFPFPKSQCFPFCMILEAANVTTTIIIPATKPATANEFLTIGFAESVLPNVQLTFWVVEPVVAFWVVKFGTAFWVVEPVVAFWVVKFGTAFWVVETVAAIWIVETVAAF